MSKAVQDQWKGQAWAAKMTNNRPACKQNQAIMYTQCMVASMHTWPERTWALPSASLVTTK